MAFREIKFIIHTGDRAEDYRLTLEIYQPVMWYMDKLMRGRFKEYSGEEVKGINIVCLHVITPTKLAEIQRTTPGIKLDEWDPTPNVLERDTVISLDEFNGTRKENVQRALEIFADHAGESDLPQMKKLVEHLKHSFGRQSLDEAIENAERRKPKHTPWYLS